MKIIDQLSVVERILVGILMSVMTLSGVILSLILEILVIEEFFSWKTLIVAIPLTAFIVLAIAYIMLWDKEDKHHVK